MHKKCKKCQSIDPNPTRSNKGTLSVFNVWERLAIDVTYFGGKKFLSVIDCGQSKFAIWKELNGESGREIARKLEEIFLERGLPSEVILDNAASFRSVDVREMCKKWNIELIYRAAFRSNCNGIIERNHRTIKRMCARANIEVREAVFWYNFLPKEGLSETNCPCSGVHKYTWRHPNIVNMENGNGNDNLNENIFIVGEDVWVKPNGAKCSSAWNVGRITKILSERKVEVNGIARHILDVRKIV